MKVILKEDVQNLGEMGSVVNVADGYGRNYLIPRNLAAEANPKNIKTFEHEKKIILAKTKKVIKSAEDLAEKLSALTLTFEEKAGEEDKLFGSVTAKDIAEEIEKQGFKVDRRKIMLEESIKRLGTYTVSVKLFKDVSAQLNIEVKQVASAEG